jgi:Flp pilus assembly protein TadG
LRSGVPRRQERGTVIVLVAVVMLFVVGAMAAISIDVVTLYTARSEAQLAADSAALAAARVLANSGATSDTSGQSMARAWAIAQAVATQVAVQNQVAGTNLTSSQVTFPNGPGGTNNSSNTNPTVTVQVQVKTLPAFFSRIWGNTQLAVSASATAEAYNPSPVSTSSDVTQPPVAPLCVKPWLLPNIDPNIQTQPIFAPTTGAIQDSALLGWQTQDVNNPASGTYLKTACTGGNCTPLPNPPLTSWLYLPGSPTNFPSPGAASVSCNGSSGFTPYQLSVAGCVQTPIACNASVGIDLSNYPTRDDETTTAVNCLTHASPFGRVRDGDSVDQTISSPFLPFEFLAGDENPFVKSGAIPRGTDVLVSDSLVTVPVFDVTTYTTSSTSVQIIGFVQLFLNPEGTGTRTGGQGQYQVHTMVTNMAGCGSGATGATGTALIGNGASPVAVRLISPSTVSQVSGLSQRKP